MSTNRIPLDMIATVHLMKRAVDNNLSSILSNQLSASQAHTISYISSQRDQQDIFQRDIEEEFKLHRSSVSLMLNNMEKSGLIQRLPVSEDRRLKKIVLTPKAEKYQHQIVRIIRETDEFFLSGITPQQLDTVAEVLARIQENLK